MAKRQGTLSLRKGLVGRPGLWLFTVPSLALQGCGLSVEARVGIGSHSASSTPLQRLVLGGDGSLFISIWDSFPIKSSLKTGPR